MARKGGQAARRNPFLSPYSPARPSLVLRRDRRESYPSILVLDKLRQHPPHLAARYRRSTNPRRPERRHDLLMRCDKQLAAFLSRHQVEPPSELGVAVFGGSVGRDGAETGVGRAEDCADGVAEGVDQTSACKCGCCCVDSLLEAVRVEVKGEQELTSREERVGGWSEGRDGCEGRRERINDVLKVYNGGPLVCELAQVSFPLTSVETDRANLRAALAQRLRRLAWRRREQGGRPCRAQMIRISGK